MREAIKLGKPGIIGNIFERAQAGFERARIGYEADLLAEILLKDPPIEHSLCRERTFRLADGRQAAVSIVTGPEIKSRQELMERGGKLSRIEIHISRGNEKNGYDIEIYFGRGHAFEYQEHVNTLHSYIVKTDSYFPSGYIAKDRKGIVEFTSSMQRTIFKHIADIAYAARMGITEQPVPPITP